MLQRCWFVTSWWNWISADQNDGISIFAPVGVCVGVLWMLAAFVCFGIKSMSPIWGQLIDLGKINGVDQG